MTEKRREPKEPLTAAQRLRRAARIGPKAGTITRTNVRLEAMPGPNGARVDTNHVPQHEIDALARAMMRAGADGRAHGAAACIASEAESYTHDFRAWAAESDATASDQILAAGKLAFALRETLEVMGGHAERLIPAGMMDEQSMRRFARERRAMVLCLSTLSLAAFNVREPHTVASKHLLTAGKLASDLLNALERLGERAENFIQASMTEEQTASGFTRERIAIMPFLLAMETAANKVRLLKRRPPNAAAREFMCGAIRTWRLVVGRMPSKPSNRMPEDTRPHALHNILRKFVSIAAEPLLERGHMVGQINPKAFLRAYEVVQREFASDRSEGTSPSH